VECVTVLNLDILCIAETHLKGSDVLTIPGYTFIGQNRKMLRKTAKAGSGGVGVLFKNSILKQCNIKALNESYDGILWVELQSKLTKDVLNICVCYLPPEGSSRKVDANDFFETLLSQVYSYQGKGKFFICGDFNSRVGELIDFNEGVDDISKRAAVDTKVNQYGALLIDFLISSNCCLLNGRKKCKDNYTSVSCKGKAVVDYCIVSHELLRHFEDFEVRLAKDVYQDAGCMGIFNTSIPDHSLLTWKLECEAHIGFEVASEWSHVYTKINRNVPENFASELDVCINRLCQQLEHHASDINVIDTVYDQFTEVLNNEMNDKLDRKEIMVECGSNFKKKFKRHKPWWTQSVQKKWVNLRKCEKMWLKYHGSGNKKVTLRANMCQAQKEFDRDVQKSKRQYWFKQQCKLLELCENDQVSFWKSIGKIGIASERKQEIPYEAVDANGNVTKLKPEVLNVWKESFEKLLNVNEPNVPTESVINCVDIDITSLNSEITKVEIYEALQKSNKGKAYGVDGIPVECLNNDRCITFLCKLYNECFTSGVFPSMWKRGLICPIPKGNIEDLKNPEGYRGITLAVSSYKLFCGIMNSRLKTWSELNNVLHDEQNGFREDRSCVDHLQSLVSIIEGRVKRKQSVFTAFIDFRKAYDSINHNMLWDKLVKNGISKNCYFLKAVQGLYKDIKCAVKVNGSVTDWFDVNTGLRQGCLLSPLLFNLYINDLVLSIKSSCHGIPIGGENVSLLMYADDLVLIARNENDLQKMLIKLYEWCEQWKININEEKSQIVHFRPRKVTCTKVVFMLGSRPLQIVDKYKYLGLMLNEFLDFKVTAEHVARSASRALGLLIAKSKAYGGMPFKCFRKLYESLVLPVIHYGAAIWGHCEYTCINAVHNRACRYFLGVGKFTANAAVQGDTGMYPPIVGQWVSITRQWCRIVNMNPNRLNNIIFKWAYRNADIKCRTWLWKTIQFFKINRLECLITSTGRLDKNHSLKLVSNVATSNFKTKWKKVISAEKSSRGSGGNKLRTYNLIKKEFETESYVMNVLGRKHRRAFSLFRSGSAPIRLETGRYESIPVSQRFCFNCALSIEDECHVLIICPMYTDLRNEVFEVMEKCYPGFITMSDLKKTQMILSSSNFINVKASAKFCSLILDRRKHFTCV